jgi:alpha-glucosidase
MVIMQKKLLVPILIFLAASTASASAAAVKEYILLSPDKFVELNVAVGANVTYAVHYKGRPVVVPSAVSMTLDGGLVLGKDPQVRDEKRRSVNDILRPVVRQKSAEIADRFNELTLVFKGEYAVIFRAYDDGVAYRFSTLFAKPITVVSEQAEFAFGQDRKLYFPEEESFQSH